MAKRGHAMKGAYFMKRVSLLIFIWSIAASAGGVNGGGGDVLQSSAEKVASEVEKAFYYYLPNLFYNLALSEFDDPYVKRVTNKLFIENVGEPGWENSQPIFDDLKSTKYWLKNEGGCLESRKESHAMGVEKFQLGEPICVSVPLLRVLPAQDLTQQIVGLFAHELAHHFGFGELDATKLQFYVLHNYQMLTGFPDDLRIRLNPLEFTVSRGKGEETREFFFQSGRSVDKTQIDKAQPHCVAYIDLDNKTREDIVLHKKEITLKSEKSSVRLSTQGGGVACGSPKGVCKTTAVEFMVNRVWDGDVWRSYGSSLERKHKVKSHNRITTITCYAKNLRSRDVVRTFEGSKK